MARDEIADMHRKLNKEAGQKGGDYIFEQKYVDAMKAFFDDPTVETARAVLEVAPSLLQYFESCAPGGNLYSTNRLLRERRTPPSR